MATEAARPSRRLLWIGLASAGLLGVALFSTHGIEWVEKVIDLGYGEEALRNRYLAAELFLREQGVKAETVSGMGILERLPSSGDALVITSTRRAMSARRVERLARWVEHGGHLLVVAREPYDEETGSSLDPLLTRYGIHLIDPGDEETGEDGEETAEPGEEVADALDESQRDESQSEEEPDAEETIADEIEQTVGDVLEEALSGELPACWEATDVIATLASRDLPRALELELAQGRRHLVHSSGESSAVALGESGAQLIHLPVGQGQLTAATSLSIWANHRIHCRDHAYLLWRLTGPTAKVWLLHDPEIPSLAALLGAKLPLTCAGVTALLLVWAAAKSIRFGPMRPGSEGERRELLEHLEASAHFLWRRGLLGGALEELREEIALRAAAHHRSWTRLDATGRIRTLAELAELPEPEVYAAFTRTPPLRRRELVHTMQTLQAIRRML
ncbi:MAG: DUF4350 domain-containing protein [Deltaproteobacteria bacterium]|nr:DUF4350 domain-containing protein [Deltaproteobacteria bacterium]MBW2417969.1 DUF4350 domain-containing protein [Deltaproteobacteria bacterium]